MIKAWFPMFTDAELVSFGNVSFRLNSELVGSMGNTERMIRQLFAI